MDQILSYYNYFISSVYNVVYKTDDTQKQYEITKVTEGDDL